MYKTIIAASVVALSMSAVHADDMTVGGLQDRNNFNLNYTNTGDFYTDLADDLDVDTLDFDEVTVGVDGRQGIIEYGVAIKEQQDSTDGVAGSVDAAFNAGVVVPLSSKVGVVGGVSKDFVGDEDVYVGAIYEYGRVEARYTYQEEAEDHKVNGRFYITDSTAIQAGVQFDDDIGEDSQYTVGISYKF